MKQAGVSKTERNGGSEAKWHKRREVAELSIQNRCLGTYNDQCPKELTRGVTVMCEGNVWRASRLTVIPRVWEAGKKAARERGTLGNRGEGWAGSDNASPRKKEKNPELPYMSYLIAQQIKTAGGSSRAGTRSLLERCGRGKIRRYSLIVKNKSQKFYS